MPQEITKEMLEKINTFTKREMSADEVYVFPVILCDNEIDRDNERFSTNALNSLAKLFIGKTGIKDHNPKASNQTARIFETEVITDESRKTSAGECYTFLKASAYMVRTSKNDDIIKEIDAGIKKEVSVSCSISKGICSICGTDTKESSCCHRKGKMYNGKRCHIILDCPTDAYEWSFVAVPAQKNAGVTKKSQGECEDEITLKRCDYEKLLEKSEKTALLCDELSDELKRKIIKLSFATNPSMPVSAVSRIAEGMSLEELVFFKSQLEKSYVTSLLPETLSEKQSESNNAFMLK